MTRVAPLPLVLLAVLAVSAPTVPLQAQTTASPQPAAVDPLFAAAQKAFDALPEGDRKGIQENLIWTGDFSGAGTGGFGPLTYKGIMAFQARQKGKPDGILKPVERAALEAQASLARMQVRFTRFLDARTGAQIGIPQKILDKVRPGATGTVYFSTDNAAMLETMGGRDDLARLYAAMIVDAPGRKVTYKVLRPDWFVVASEAGGRRTYVRMNAARDSLRGYSFSYPVARAAEFDKLSIAIANSFDQPLPAGSPAAPAVAGPGQPGPQVLPPGPARPPALLLTGFAVAPGKVVTTAAIEACAAPLVARQPATLARVDKALGLALLDAPASRAAAAAPSGTAPADGAELVVVGFTGPGTDVQLSAAPGEARVPVAGSLRIFAPLQRGAPGSPVFDRSGTLVGLVASIQQEPRQVAGIMPASSWPMVPAAALAQFGGAVGAAKPPAGPMTTGAIVAAARPWLVAVECAR
jgi:hypothetical protein